MGTLMTLQHWIGFSIYLINQYSNEDWLNDLVNDWLNALPFDWSFISNIWLINYSENICGYKW